MMIPAWRFYFELERIKQTIRNVRRRVLAMIVHPPERTFEEIVRSQPRACDIWLNRKSGEFLLCHYCVDPKTWFTLACGDLMHVSPGQMQAEGLRLVLDSLSGFRTRVYQISDLDLCRMTKQEDRRFRREHQLVGIRQETATQLSLTPMRREKGGHIGEVIKTVLVNLPCTSEEFYKKLMEVFEKCE